MARSANVEDNIVRAFLKSVGAELGFYNAGTKSFIDGLEEQALYRSNLSIVKDALKQGWTAAELEEFLFRRYKAGERAALLSEILPKKNPDRQFFEGDNLLEEGASYHHPALYDRIAPRYTVQGETLVPTTRGRTIPKVTYTLKDLTQYYFDAMRVACIPRTWSAAVGVFRYLLQDTAVDEILTAIDLAREQNDELPPIGLSDYLPEAQRELAERRSRIPRSA